MLKNLGFILIAAFWVLMNVLLWQSQFGSGHKLVSSVPPSTVLEKILTAPDDSTLGIILDDTKVGYIRWRPRVEGTGASGQVASGSSPEGMVTRISEYNLEMDGSFLLQQFDRTIKLAGKMDFDDSMRWQEFELEASMRPMRWEVKGRSAERDLWIKAAEGHEDWVRRFTFDELKDPAGLLRELNVPLPGLPTGQGSPSPSKNTEGIRIEWEARFDWLQISGSRVRIYRLEGRAGPLQIVVLVSRVGEILRVDLPGQVKLLNDALFAI